MLSLYHTLLYQPLLTLLTWLYTTVAFQNLGIAIIELTVLVRIVLFPVFWRSMKSHTIMQKMQPHVKRIQEDHKDNKEKQMEALFKLYKEHKFNPLLDFLLLLIQLPLLIALYQVMYRETGNFDNYLLFGFINLREKSIVMAGLAAIAQYAQMYLAMPRGAAANDPSAKTARMMSFFGPALTLVILVNLTSSIGLYWLVSSLFSVGQQLVINKTMKEKAPKTA